MKKLTRVLTMGGFGMLAALATGVGPAQAATASGATVENKSGAAHQVQWRDGEQVVGFYRSLRNCELAGNFGERSGDWDDHRCAPVRVGVRRGAWALQVASYDNWDRHGFGIPFRAIGGFPTRFRPAWAGEFRPGRPGPVIIVRPGNHGPRGNDHHGGPWGNDHHDGPRGNDHHNGPRR